MSPLPGKGGQGEDGDHQTQQCCVPSISSHLPQGQGGQEGETEAQERTARTTAATADPVPCPLMLHLSAFLSTDAGGQGLWSFLQLRRGLAGRGQRAPADPPLRRFSLQVTDLGPGMQQVLSGFAIMVDFLPFDFSPTLLGTHFTREKAEVQRGKDRPGHAARRSWQD